MKPYRSLDKREAVQYAGEPIEGVTCDGKAQDCGNDSRRHLPHVHTKDTGGLRCLSVGDWIMPSLGGPFFVLPDAIFRSRYEVVADAPAVEVEIPAVTEPAVDPVEKQAVAEAETAPVDTPIKAKPLRSAKAAE